MANSCVLYHNQRIIRFECTLTHESVLIDAFIYYFSAQEAKFRFERNEKYETKQKCRLENQIAIVVKDVQKGFRLPVFLLNLSAGNVKYVYAFALDWTEKIGRQLIIYRNFALPKNTNFALLVDGPTFLLYNSHDLRFIYHGKKEHLVENIPRHLEEVILNEFDNCLYLIDAGNSNLIEFCIQSGEMRSKGPLVGPKWWGGVDKVLLRSHLELYLGSKSQICVFQNGKLLKSALLPMEMKIVDLVLYETVQRDVLLVLGEDKTVVAVCAESLRVIEKWTKVDRLGIDDVLGTGNKLILVQFESPELDFVDNLNDNSLVTDSVDVFYSKAQNLEKHDLECTEMSHAAKAIENKLRVGHFMLADSKTRLNETDECIDQIVARIRDLNATGIVNPTPIYPHVTDLTFPVPEKAEIESLNAKQPLKIIESGLKIHDKWLLVLIGVENTLKKPLTNFSLQLDTEKSIEYRVKFHPDRNHCASVLRNLELFDNPFKSESPTLKTCEKMHLIASIALYQQIFENLTFEMQISLVFQQIHRKQLLQQICGSVNVNLDTISTVKPDFHIFHLPSFENEIRLVFNSTTTNLENLEQLLTDNLALEFDSITNILHFPDNATMQITDLNTQNQNQAQIRIFYTSETQLIHLIHSIYAKLPPDVVLTPKFELQHVTRTLKCNLQTELDLIHQIFTTTQLETAQSTAPPRAKFEKHQNHVRDLRKSKIEWKNYSKIQNQLKTSENQTDSLINQHFNHFVNYHNKNKHQN